MTYLPEGECSYGRAEEEEKIEHRSSGCSRYLQEFTPLCRRKLAFWSAGLKCGHYFHAAESGRRWDEMEGRYQCAVLAPYKVGHSDCRMHSFVRYRGLSPVDSPCLCEFQQALLEVLEALGRPACDRPQCRARAGARAAPTCSAAS